ncbi:Asp23/Gls24 family envelope stress response protein [Microlunatus flavus]|uniref:Uncharacterized conserved protein YloU, alkaline shock protein (Asp23) family n=1 Tax=Microlunatus flavus TaxID=1036181 RepID=A0A1H9F2T1_9ACTN|nr:Asp23/Gls24 family envelope stress response protein [Microlunatus flavus]SEQ31743.1 Uncharacterized conserved protein YloU, alkaline shock protein (Asp23) family [Microlunatus flavus]
MSASTVTPAAGAGAAPRRSAPASRGRLVLGDKVVEKVAGQAASEVRGVLGREGGVLGVGAHADAGARPSVDVDLGRESADVALTVGLTYPGSVRRVTSELREHVAQRVEALTGVAVHRVDVDVRFLVVPGADGADEPRERLR